MPQFNYCQLVWMCHSRGLNNKTNNTHKRALRIVGQDKKSNLQDLLQKDKICVYSDEKVTIFGYRNL